MSRVTFTFTPIRHVAHWSSKLVFLLIGLCAMSVNSATELYFIHNDHLGTPVAVTDQSQSVVWEAQRLPFGKTGETGSISERSRFPGQYFDAETDLNYNYFRNYDTSTGRYHQADPVGLLGWRSSSLTSKNDLVSHHKLSYPRRLSLNHLYLYAISNPLSYADSVGLHPEYVGRRKRGNQDPVRFEPVDVGSCGGICNPCPANQVWKAEGDHGASQGEHWHGIVWDQNPITCICYPRRVDI